MHIEVGRDKPDYVIICESVESSLVAVLDGDGSWGAGREAAEFCRLHLRAAWVGGPPRSISEVLSNFEDAIDRMPHAVKSDEFGDGLYATVLLCFKSRVEWAAAGLYQVNLFQRDENKTIYRPRTLRDEMIASGIDPHEVGRGSEPFARVNYAPVIGHGGQHNLQTGADECRPGDVCMIADYQTHLPRNPQASSIMLDALDLNQRPAALIRW